MFQVHIEENVVEDLLKEEIRKQLEELDHSLVFWDTKELRRRTCMSWSTIQDTFFHHEDFPKAKIGGKWYFPAKSAEAFLLEWLKGHY